MGRRLFKLTLPNFLPPSTIKCDRSNHDSLPERPFRPDHRDGRHGRSGVRRQCAVPVHL